MEQDHIKRIEEIIRGMKCEKDFRCCKPGFGNLCKARDKGLEGYLDCIDKDSDRCEFRLPFGNGFFCRCPLRVYIGKKLTKNGELTAEGKSICEKAVLEVNKEKQGQTPEDSQ